MNKGCRVAKSQSAGPGESLRDLKVLEAIEECPTISQRDLAARLGVALGLANACLTRMAKTGLVKIQRVNSRNLTYHLTPAGVAAKARLSIEYARTTVDFYRAAKQGVAVTLAALSARGVRRICLLGATDLAEIVGVVCSYEGITIEAVAEQDAEEGRQFMGMPVVPIEELKDRACEAVLVTYLDDVDFWVDYLKGKLPPDIDVVRAL